MGALSPGTLGTVDKPALALTAAIFIVDGSFFAYNLQTSAPVSAELFGFVCSLRKGDGGKDEEQVGDAAAVKEDIAGPGSTSTDILSKFEIYCKDYALMIYVARPWTILMPWCSNN